MSTETLNPTGLVSEANWTTTPSTEATLINTLDDGVDASDNSWLLVSDLGAEVSVNVSFPTPTGDLNTGANLQKFRARVRPNDAGANGDPVPHLNVFESGTSFVADANATAILNTAGETIYEFTWDATGLTSIDGSNVECQFVGDSNGNGGNANNLDIEAIEWVVDYAAAATAKAGTDAIDVSFSVESSDLCNDFASVDSLDTAFSVESISGFGTADRSDNVGINFSVEDVNLFGLLTRSDTLGISFTEAVEISSVVAANDSIDISISELVSFIVELSRLDTLDITVAATALDIFSTINRIDALGISFSSETVNVATLLNITDALDISITEAAPTVTVTVAGNDVVDVSVSELVIILNALDSIDTLSVAFSSEVSALITLAAGTTSKFNASLSLNPTLTIKMASIIEALNATVTIKPSE